MNPAAETKNMRHRIVLEGCTPTPLASYLKALAILRLVAEQVDSSACGYWSSERFVLESQLDRPALGDFLLERWQPTPIIAPWNGGSGFYPKDNQDGIGPLETTVAGRFQELRATICQARKILAESGLVAIPDKEQKPALLTRLRAELSDAALVWFDAAVLLTEESPRYPPLLGTGGNDGRLDFTNNFMQRLVELFDAETGEPRGPSRVLLEESLFARPAPDMPTKKPIGQFAPGSAGGPNASTGFDGAAMVNPWDFVLMLEGALLFAASASRRLEASGHGTLSYPFTVYPTGSGSGSAALADERPARAEIWLPLWSAPVRLAELRSLLSEGRVSLGRRPVRDGLDFMRAVSKLGLERGITDFQRYAFMMRAGKAFLATPLNRIHVQRNPSADLIDQLDADGWLERVRKLGRSDHGSNQWASLVRQLEDGLFDLSANRDYAALQVQRLLMVLGRIQRHLARSPRAREACGPVPVLQENWVTTALAGDDSPELALALALAGLHGRSSESAPVLFMAEHMAPSRQDATRRWWLDGSDNRVVWGTSRLERNLAAVLQRRLLDARGLALADKPLFAAASAPLSAVQALLDGSLDDRRIEALLCGLMLARMPVVRAVERDRSGLPVPSLFALLKPFFSTDAQLQRIGVLQEGESLALSRQLVRWLETDRLDDASEHALRRLRVAGVAPALRNIKAGELSGRRLLSALLVPLSDTAMRRLARPFRQRSQIAAHIDT